MIQSLKKSKDTNLQNLFNNIPKIQPKHDKIEEKLDIMHQNVQKEEIDFKFRDELTLLFDKLTKQEIKINVIQNFKKYIRA